MDDYPVEPISIDEIFKQKAVTTYQGKRVTWRCMIEKVQPFNDNWPGLTQPAFPWNSIARVLQTVTFTFNDRPSYEKLKAAKAKHSTISGIVSPGPMNGSADLKGCRVVSVE